MLTFSEIQTLKRQLLGYWGAETERCGVIEANQIIAEVPNLSKDPKNTFTFRMEDLHNGVEATWHSHPVTAANLSIEDYRFFQSWPQMVHFIIGVDGVRCYQVIDGIVYCVEDEADYSPRQDEGALQQAD